MLTDPKPTETKTTTISSLTTRKQKLGSNYSGFQAIRVACFHFRLGHSNFCEVSRDTGSFAVIDLNPKLLFKNGGLNSQQCQR